MADTRYLIDSIVVKRAGLKLEYTRQKLKPQHFSFSRRKLKLKLKLNERLKVD